MKHYGDLYEQQMKWFEIIDALETLPEEESIPFRLPRNIELLFQYSMNALLWQ